MEFKRSENIVWHDTSISYQDRIQLNKHQGLVLWFTGLSGSGKSTIANEVERMLYLEQCHTYLLDGDNIRHGLNRDLGFSDQDREENIRRIGEVAKLFADAGMIALSSFISPFTADRQLARHCCEPRTFIEIFIDTPISICESRDPKGLYKKARAGEIQSFTGISSPYEAPINPEIHVKTADLTIEDAAKQIINYLRDNHYI
ncbi:adenylyl-sulfate kinase [Photobacterium leiognathi]|uniref:adenylyl-sulfate kinase n=1 Tax=Photobacterium leiognathi TaxID=553611 RepID=UPI00298137AA|nr:adenylyl-sulfate kinase [Photobacterium leiognathi]